MDDTDLTFKHTALRELHEEFLGIQVPPDVADTDIIHFNTKLTRPVKNRLIKVLLLLLITS